MKPIIQSEKWVLQQSLIQIDGSDNATIIIARASEDAVAKNTLPDIAVGSNIKAIYCELWLLSATSGIGTFIVTVEKSVNDAAIPIPFGNMTALDSYANKKNIFYTSQGVIGDMNSNAVPVVRQWVRIPKGKQRMGRGDQMIINVTAQVPTDLSICGVFIYKTYQ